MCRNTRPIRRESHWRSEGLLLVLEPEERSDGPEGLLVRQLHVDRRVRKHSWFDKLILRPGLSAEHDLGTIRKRVVDMTTHLVDRSPVHQRADRDTLAQSAADDSFEVSAMRRSANLS